MSKLEELIQQLCPDGVIHSKLCECTKMTRGVRVVKSQLSNNAPYPVYQNSMTPLGYYDKSNFPANTTFIISAGAAGEVGYSTKYFWAADDCWCFSCKENINSKYLYHVLLWKQQYLYSKVRKASIPRLSRNDVDNIKIPVPPLPVQEEIVRILDAFTELTTELTIELTIELEARKKQYEYYRDSILPFDVAEKYQLGDVATIMRGASPRPIKSFVTKDENGVNWIKIGDAKVDSKYITETKERITEEGAKKSRYVRPGDFILSNSMSFGRPYILKIFGCIHDGWLSISNFEDKLSPDFLYHVLTSTYMQGLMRKKASFGGAVQNLNADIVRELEIPVPPLAEQERIVSILDRFDTLCNDLTSGLTAEIEDRKKQYEYYQDKLLTFKEKE